MGGVGTKGGSGKNERDCAPQRTVAGMGQLSRSLTREKNPEKGVALSRARDHQTRPTC